MIHSSCFSPHVHSPVRLALTHLQILVGHDYLRYEVVTYIEGITTPKVNLANQFYLLRLTQVWKIKILHNLKSSLKKLQP